jgi:hypothetical protein
MKRIAKKGSTGELLSKYKERKLWSVALMIMYRNNVNRIWRDSKTGHWFADEDKAREYAKEQKVELEIWEV